MKSGDKTGVGDIDLPMPRSSSKRTRGQVDNQTGHEESANEDDQTGCWAQETRGDGDGLDKALVNKVNIRHGAAPSGGTHKPSSSSASNMPVLVARYA